MQHNEGIPGIFFKFNLDPLAITQHQRTTTSLQLIRCVGVIGRVFVCMGYAIRITTRASGSSERRRPIARNRRGRSIRSQSGTQIEMGRGRTPGSTQERRDGPSGEWLDFGRTEHDSPLLRARCIRTSFLQLSIPFPATRQWPLVMERG
ncbi:hypothetical protein K443DRAFT_340346 [Laccaria amethystina LaAM-08-1]|jgi:hypothetical protein|uniref:Unplaced genomic scaffold K443scaffold_236, whole genome shotgun sequence n=1 Tax=Laccaria amethystina LaAM-08-1 TaxID=1095629 RepID=A0A0C9WJN1_9AGAR|nr:hypothetical protein K443DRAFT_340346 [Laccaria amethystina LaAM-08-1]